MAETEELEMPPCDAAFLASYLFEMGPTLPAGPGEGPLTHLEIASWQRNTGIELDSWQARMLRRLSQDYANESAKAKERDCPAPWQGAPYAKPTASIIAERMRRETRELASL